MKRRIQFLLGACHPGSKLPSRFRRRNECGSSLVEFAFIIIFLMTILFGVAGFGYALFVYHGVSNLARNATRWAAVNGSTCNGDRKTTTDPNDVGSCTAPITYDSTSNTYSLCTATSTSACAPASGTPGTGTGACNVSNQCDIGNYVLMTSSGLNPNSINTTVSYPYNSADNPSSCDPSSAAYVAYNAPGCTVQVEVSYTFNFPLIFTSTPVTLSSTSEMIIDH